MANLTDIVLPSTSLLTRDNTQTLTNKTITYSSNTLTGVAPLASPTFTGTVTLPNTTSIGDVSATEVSYLDGVTSSIQTQISAKANIASPTFTGTLTAPTINLTNALGAAYGGTGLTSPGTSGNILTSNYDPTNAWNLGCQFVLMNFQKMDTPMDKYINKFRNKAFVLKPQSLRV